MKARASLALIAACCSCGQLPPGNSAYQGSWNAFSVNGSPSLGGFEVDDHGRFNFTSGDAQVSGVIGPDGSV